MRRVLTVLGFAVAAAVGAAQVFIAAGQADEPFDAKLTRLRASQPEGYRFEVTLGDGRDTYRLGEPIPMRLDFGPGQWISERTRPDDAGWEWIVAEALDGGEFSDALEGLLSLDMAWRMTCSYLDRTVGPFAIQTFLNEWLRFRKPGHYRFFVRSFRAFGRGEVVSNVVSLRILAADESRWERLMWQWENGARDEAARGIRYIGTPEATEFMGRHLREHTSFTVGLANSPPLETLRALAGVDDTNGLRGFQILRLVAPVALPYGPWQDREEGWRREAAQRLSSVYQAGLQALNGWLEPGN